MIGIKPDVKIFDTEKPSNHDRSRVSLNSGTVKASELASLSQDYCTNAYIPKSDWRTPNDEEYSALMATAIPIDSGKWISIVRIPDEVLSPFEKLREASRNETETTLFEIKKAPACQLGIEQVLKYIVSLNASVKQPFEGTGISIRPPKLLTGTYDHQRNCYVGLHLDSWYKQPLPERHLSPNRICINLGTEDRFFLFINLTLKTMFDLLGENALSSPSTLGAIFMKNFSDYPVARIRVSPNEAYIAPTENIIHDGSSKEKNYYDVNLTVRGQFKSAINA